jgi:hypothetical protein
VSIVTGTNAPKVVALNITTVVADAILSFAANWTISYDTGTPRMLILFGSLKSPKIYSVFSSAPSKVRVISTRP